jgi:hypothetical protein
VRHDLVYPLPVSYAFGQYLPSFLVVGAKAHQFLHGNQGLFEMARHEFAEREIIEYVWIMGITGIGLAEEPKGLVHLIAPSEHDP